jgi:opacity protein-like surface antigen
MGLRTIAATVLVASSLIASAGVAQKGKLGAAPPWTVGPVLGLNYFTFTGSDATDAKYKAGLAVGLALSRDIAPSIFFAPEALYSMKGASFSSGGVTDRFKVNYLEVPVLFGYRFDTHSQTQPYVVAGPTVGLMLSCNLEETSGSTTQSASCKDLGIDTKSTDFGITGGAGVEFPLSSMTLTLTGRYTIGLSDVVSNFSVKNSGFSFTAGLMFPLRH